MELPEHSLAIFALDKQLNNIHKTKLLTTHTYIKQMLFLSNLELSISPIVNDPGLLLPQESDFETIFIDQVNELFDNCTSDSQDFQGILIQKGPPPLKIPLAASDASLFTYNDRKFAASAAFFGISSRLNVAIPTFDSSISTELPEITGIIIALQQAVSNNITHLHLVCDNQSAMQFIKEAICLGIQKSNFLQGKVLANTVYKQKALEANLLSPQFSFLSISHAKSHTQSTHKFNLMNDGADKAAKECVKQFAQSVSRFEIN